MEQNAVMLAIGVVLLVATAAAWGWYLRSLVRRRRRLRSWRRVAADVVEVRRSRESVTIQNQTQRYTVLQVRYEFTDPTGARQSGDGVAREKVEEGRHLEVMHDPDAPAHHELVAAAPAWANLLLLALFSMLPLGGAVITTMLGLGFE